MRRDPMQAIERDLQAERASTLGRTADLLEKALAAWEALEAGRAPELWSLEARVERRLELRAFVAERLWMLMVQREAVGFRDHRALLERVPKEIRVRIGPRRRGASVTPT